MWKSQRTNNSASYSSMQTDIHFEIHAKIGVENWITMQNPHRLCNELFIVTNYSQSSAVENNLNEWPQLRSQVRVLVLSISAFNLQWIDKMSTASLGRNSGVLLAFWVSLYLTISTIIFSQSESRVPTYRGRTIYYSFMSAIENYCWRPRADC